MVNDRRDFIKLMLSALPLSFGLTEVINLSRQNCLKSDRKRIKLLMTSVAGLYYYEGYESFELLKENDKIFLKPQPKNPYDKHAVEIFHSKSHMKLGYIPRYKNIIISSMLIDGLKIDGHILKLVIDKKFDYRDVIVNLYLNL
ncbi:MAG: HIRAN domain-containing protein [bacterium]